METISPRGTDWTLAALVAGLALTGALTLFSGPLVFALHDVVGFALTGVLIYKFRRVWRRLLTRRAGAIAAALVIVTLATGIAWSSAIHPTLLGYNELFWHDLLGAVLAVAVLTHAFQRAKKPRARDLTRRQLLTSAGVGIGALIAWRVTRREAPLHRQLRDRRGLPRDLLGRRRTHATRATTA